MEISISKSEIFKEVEKRTVLESTRYPEQYDNLWATEYEAGFLDTYWIEGCSALINLLKRYIASVTTETVLSYESNDEALEIEAEMPARFDKNLTGSIITDMKMMLVCNVLAGWLNVKNADLSKKYEDEALSYATGLAQKLLYRVPPQREMIEKGSDRLRIKQYERCNNNIEQERDSFGCGGCLPCDRPQD